MANLPEETTNFLEAMNRMFSRSELIVLTKLFKDVAFVKEFVDKAKSLEDSLEQDQDSLNPVMARRRAND